MQNRILLQFGIYKQCQLGFGKIVKSEVISNIRSYSDCAYFHQVGKDALVYKNWGQQLQQSVEKYAQRLAIISCYEDQKLTFEDAKQKADILAVQLKQLGLQRGEHLGIWAPNTIQWYISLLAAFMGGFPLVCINPSLQANELEYALRKAKVRMLITMDEFGQQNFHNILKDVLPELKEESKIINDSNLPELRSIVMSSRNARNQFPNYEQLLQMNVKSKDLTALNESVSKIPPESICNIQFTSGTTGQPKAALLTHFNFINEIRYFGEHLNLHQSHKRICLTVPFFHCFGLGVAMAALKFGATLVLPTPTFNSVAALEAIENERCNIILGTPTMYVDMLQNQQKLQKSMDSLELGLVGGATCSPELYFQVLAELKLKELRIGYGQSESTLAIFTHNGTENMKSAAGTVGKLYEHGEAKVINSKGETVAFGEPGELCVRGFFTMRGYYDDETKTKEVLCPDGWLKTGDEFILESTGIGRIIGRKKDIIIRGGENIFPKEIEDFLDTHNDILESQIIGVPDDRMGEEICAYLRLKPDAKNLTVEDLKQFCKQKIAHFKIPRYVRVVKEFPKTNSGKIQKFMLRKMFEK